MNYRGKMKTLCSYPVVNYHLSKKKKIKINLLFIIFIFNNKIAKNKIIYKYVII